MTMEVHYNTVSSNKQRFVILFNTFPKTFSWLYAQDHCKHAKSHMSLGHVRKMEGAWDMCAKWREPENEANIPVY